MTSTTDQDWSLRVTLVFRRAGDRWQIVHRHADPFVNEIPFDRFAQLARDAIPFDRFAQLARDA